MNEKRLLDGIDEIMRQRAVGRITEVQAINAIRHLMSHYDIQQWCHCAAIHGA